MQSVIIRSPNENQGVDNYEFDETIDVLKRF